MNKERIILIDAFNVIYRFYYGCPFLSSKTGVPTNITSSIIKLLKALEVDYPHSYGAFIFDQGQSEERCKLHPDYKGNRDHVELKDMNVQIPYIKRWAEAAGWPIIAEQGREADDLIGAIAKRSEGLECLIVSNDKDLSQLVTDNVFLLKSKTRGMFDKIDKEAVIKKFGIPPELIVDYLSLVGDAVDNIKGVNGVGPKTAARLLNKYGSVESIQSNLSEIKGKLQQNLIASKDILTLNKKLVCLYDREPEGWEGLATITKTIPDTDKMIEIASELNINISSILQRSCYGC